MNITIQTTCQFYENYNIDGDTPYYKIKGMHTFEFEVHSSKWMYDEDEVKSIINDKIARWCDTSSPNSCRYIPVEWNIKTEVTEFGIIDVEEYEPTEGRVKNQINPTFCSPAAKDTIQRLANFNPAFREAHLNYAQFDPTHPANQTQQKQTI